jgi:dephospho-CoA kinase
VPRVGLTGRIGSGRSEVPHVREQYVGDVHLVRYAKLLGALTGG